MCGIMAGLVEGLSGIKLRNLLGIKGFCWFHYSEDKHNSVEGDSANRDGKKVRG